MEKLAILVIPVLIAILLIRILFMPIRLLCKLSLHSACGFLCLWMLNTIAPFTGVLLPINSITVLTAGILGLPGISIIALLAVV